VPSSELVGMNLIVLVVCSHLLVVLFYASDLNIHIVN